VILPNVSVSKKSCDAESILFSLMVEGMLISRVKWSYRPFRNN